MNEAQRQSIRKALVEAAMPCPKCEAKLILLVRANVPTQFRDLVGMVMERGDGMLQEVDEALALTEKSVNDGGIKISELLPNESKGH